MELLLPALSQYHLLHDHDTGTEGGCQAQNGVRGINGGAEYRASAKTAKLRDRGEGWGANWRPCSAPYADKEVMHGKSVDLPCG